MICQKEAYEYRAVIAVFVIPQQILKKGQGHLQITDIPFSVAGSVAKRKHIIPFQTSLCRLLHYYITISSQSILHGASTGVYTMISVVLRV